MAIPIVEMLLKYGAYILGPALIIIGAFFLGIRHADKNALIERLESERKLSQDINKAEETNNKLEEQRNETINHIRDTSATGLLLKLWAKSPWGPKS